MKLVNLAALAALMAAGSAATQQAGPDIGGFEPDFFPKQKRGKGQNNRRGKGKSNPPKSRPNRLTISKRVRRKHRRGQ